jgi:ornithine carbamoyltransferase
VRSLLRTSDLAPDDLTHLLDLSDEVRRQPMRRRDLLSGRIVLIYMDKPSTRTRLSFDAAVHRLGGDAVVVGPDELQLGRGETVEDTARVVSRYAGCFIIRTFADDLVRRFAEAASIPVINALTDLHHPCQSVADLFTLRQRFGELRGLRVAYVGDGQNNVAHSLIEAAALSGLELRVASPWGYRPDPPIMALALEIASETGARIEVTDNPIEAVRGAAAVYTDTWFSMGVSEAERASRAVALERFRVDRRLMARAAPNAIFMHCLPAHRGEEVTADVIDGPQSVVFDQAENRLHTEQAILVALLGRRLMGRVGTPEHAVFVAAS